MNNKKIIGFKELTICVLSLCIGLFPMIGTALILENSKNASIISVILGAIVGVIPLLILLYISKYVTNKTIFQLNKENFKLLGNIINILYVIAIIYTGFIISWEIINFTITQLIFRTSYYFVILVLFFILGFAVTKGYEVIGRSSLVLGIIGIIVFALIILFLSFKVEINNLYPIINISNKEFIKTILIVPTFIIVPLLSILTIKKDNIDKPNKYNLSVILGYISSTLIICIILFLIISIYGSELASIFSYPEYYLYKKINAFEFVSRVENFAAITIYISCFGSMCMLISFVKNYFTETFKIKKEKSINILTYFLAITIPIISIYIFKNYQVFFLIKIYPLVGWCTIGILFINAILLFMKRKKLNKTII